MIPSKERTGYISEGEPVFTSCLTSQSTTHTRLAQPPAQVSGWSVSKGHPIPRNLCKSQLTFNAKCRHLSYQGWHHIQPFKASKATCSRCWSARLIRAWRLQAVRESPVLSITGSWNDPWATHPQGRTWSHQEGLQPLQPALSTSTRSQEYIWILHTETQDFSLLKMLPIKKHPRQPHLKHPLTQSVLQVLQCTPAQTLATPTLRTTGDEELQDQVSKTSSLILVFLTKLFIFTILRTDKEFQSLFKDRYQLIPDYLGKTGAPPDSRAQAFGSNCTLHLWDNPGIAFQRDASNTTAEALGQESKTLAWSFCWALLYSGSFVFKFIEAADPQLAWNSSGEQKISPRLRSTWM